MANITEHVRKEAISQLFGMATFQNCWTIWEPEIRQFLGATPTAARVLDLGDELARIFRTSAATGGRSQSQLSGGGAAWEGLVCWYLNLCLIGTQGVVIKQNRKLIPAPLSDAFTVSYGTVPSNTESDLVGITFPNQADYLLDTSTLNLPDITVTRRGGRFNYKAVVDYLCDRDFRQFEANIIQCKTNWNDNAQIPMLWDMIYASRGFANTRISVGANNYQISALQRFSYSFVTVPSNATDQFQPNSVAVQRVTSLSGGNYWGMQTAPQIAASLKDFFARNFASAAPSGIRNTLSTAIPLLSTTHSYFGL